MTNDEKAVCMKLKLTLLFILLFGCSLKQSDNTSLKSQILPNYHAVTSLQDDGPGTLRECMEGTDTRICSFAVGGPIRLASPIIISSPNLIVLGSTAPSLVELRGAGIRIQASNVSISHIAVRPGALNKHQSTFDGITLWSKGELKNIRLSNLSLTWAVDENLSTYGPNIHDVIVEHSIIAEGLHCSIHPDGCHSKGVLIDQGGKNILFYQNLFAHNQDRNVRMKSDVQLSFVNNIVYGWGGSTSWNYLNFADKASYPPTFVNFIYNFYKPSKTSSKLRAIYSDKNIPKESRVFVKGNITPTRQQQNQDEWLVSALPRSMQALKPFGNLEQLELVQIENLPSHIEKTVGPRPNKRSRTDTRIINEMLTGTGGIKDCVEKCKNNAGGWD